MTALHTPGLRTIRGLAALAAASTAPLTAHAQLVTYYFAGEITEVTQNENDVIPGLTPGDPFTGFTTFESSGWDNTPGEVRVSLNGLDLYFSGPSLFGQESLDPSSGAYSIQVLADTAGGVPLPDSSVNAGSFGYIVEDLDGSSGIDQFLPETYPPDALQMSVFQIGVEVLPSADFVQAIGLLTYLSTTPVPEPASLALIGISGLGLASRRRRRA